MIQNLGLVKAIFVGATPPQNQNVIWRDTSINPALHKYYNTTTSSWEAFIFSVLIDNNTIKKDVDGKLYVDESALSEFVLADKSVTLAKMADVPQNSVLFRESAGTGSWEVIALTDLKTKLGLQGTNTGDQDLSIYALRAYEINGKPLSGNITLTPADIGSPAGSGTSTGTNTGDETEGSILAKLGLDSISGVNTGDETYESILEIFGLEEEEEETFTLISTEDLDRLRAMSNAYTIVLPAETTVASRVLGAVEGTDYPTGWVIEADTNPGDLKVTHNLDRRVAFVTVFSVDGIEETQLYANAAFSGIFSPDRDTVIIRSLATIETPIVIHILFS